MEAHTKIMVTKKTIELPDNFEPCRIDLREYSCFPYPPPENQGQSVTCVAHSFAMALYCAERMHSNTNNNVANIDYPELE